MRKKKVWENENFEGAIMPSKDTKTLKFNQYQKPDKVPSIIYAYLESLIKKVDACKNNPVKSPTPKIGEHITMRLFYV